MTNVPSNPDPYRRFLLFGGIGAVLVGAIMAIAGNRAGQEADSVAQFVASMSGNPAYMAASGDGVGYAWMWAGMALIAVGAVMLLIFVSIKAGSASQ